VTENLVKDGNHYLWIKINKLSLNIGAIYKPPNTSDKDFIEIYKAQLERIKRSIIIGDFNIDLLKKKDNTLSKYIRTVKDLGYNILNKVAEDYGTRKTVSTNTILDHICTDMENHEFSVAIIDSALSDHKQIFVEISKLSVQSKKSIRYEALNYQGLLDVAKESKDK
jgi:uncharacterized protein (UPF0264 family)